jgi:hypothetical protein
VEGEVNDNDPDFQIGMDVHALECAIAALANHAVTHNALMRRDRVRLGNALGRLQIVVSALEVGPMLQAAE